MGTTAEKLARVKATKEAIKNALITRGQTVNDTDSFNSYADKVLNLAEAGSIKPAGTKAITSNGTHDVTSYASVSVNVAGGATPSAPSLEWAYLTLASATSERPKHEFTGICIPRSHTADFNESWWIDAVGDTYAQTAQHYEAGLFWQNDTGGCWVLKNTPFILWCTPDSSSKPTAPGLVYLDETPINKVVAGNAAWTGYKCYVTDSAILW